jgi:hypothetical protein
MSGSLILKTIGGLLLTGFAMLLWELYRKKSRR